MSLKYITLICTLVLLLGGCTYLSHYDELMALKRLGDNQAVIQRYIDKQEKLFYQLRDDAQNNRLKKGLSMHKVLYRYGEPIFCRSVENCDEVRQTCLYRHPTNYFSSDLVYLNFNQNRSLYSWELIKANK